MAITANGIGSGLDISGLVKQLMTLEARPLNQLNSREASFQARLSAFGQIKSVLSPLQSALSGLNDASRFQAMRATVARLAASPSVYLAALELQLEATRRPDLRADITARVRADLEANLAFHEEAGMPGGRDTVLVLYLALNWLVTEHLTLPGVLAPEGGLEELVTRVVDRVDLGG